MPHSAQPIYGLQLLGARLINAEVVPISLLLRALNMGLIAGLVAEAVEGGVHNFGRI
jgi:hypothetical protein